jgi:hypothetical protein
VLWNNYFLLLLLLYIDLFLRLTIFLKQPFSFLLKKKQYFSLFVSIFFLKQKKYQKHLESVARVSFRKIRMEF